MIYSLSNLSKELNKKDIRKFCKLIKKYRDYDKIDILIELSKKRSKNG